MAPLLIDSRDLLKLVFISVLVTVLVFASGFFIGIQRAEAFYQAGSVVHSLVLPEQVAVVENITDSQLPDSIEAGEDIDVDQPDTIVETSPITLAAVNKNIPASHGSDNTRPAKPSIAEQQMEIKQLDATQVTMFTSDELSKIKYSVQVGMYGRLINAENMMKMLQAQKYETYITDYTNEKNEIRYNVRIGYFSDKKSAISSLEKYKSHHKGDGYLVRFSADNIVNIARAADGSQTVTAPVHNEDSDKDLTPVANPSEITPDQLSQADVLNDGLTKNN